MNIKNITFVILLIPGCTFPLSAQETEIVSEVQNTSPARISLNMGADLVSGYIWRGQNFGHSAAIQPTVSLDAYGFSFGAWGSYAFTRYTYRLNDSISMEDNFTEIDLFLSYTYKYVTILLTDYYAHLPLDTLPGSNYFHWNNPTTWHTLEASLIITGTETFPLQFIAATLIYGVDKGKDTTGVYGAGTRNNYSTYFGLSYRFEALGFALKPFIGGIPFGSAWYGPKTGINNVGINVRREIPVSKRFSIPVQSNLVFNPLSKKAYLVFILSL